MGKYRGCSINKALAVAVVTVASVAVVAMVA